MPKYPADKRRYYDDMSDRGRSLSRGHRGKRNPDDPDRQQDRSRSSSQIQQGTEPYPRRPGPPEQGAGPSSSHSVAAYQRPSTSSGPPGGPYPSSARGEHIRSADPRPQPAYSETASETASVTGSVDGGGSSSTLGRGALRGRRVLPANIITRPTNIETKQGGHGKQIELQANYFRLLSTTDWCLHKYRVDFSPEEDRKIVCKALLRPHREILGAYIFDGSTLYTSTALPELLELVSQRIGDNQVMTIKIKRTGEMTRGDHDYIQFFNIIMRKCLDYLELQLVGRNYFDARNKTEIQDYRLELWPGYITSIRQHERDILLCAEITNKVMRRETLLDILIECHKRDRNNYQTLFYKQVVGVVVLTDYNNNTYRVDDVDYSVTPNSTFNKKNGEAISYCDYYKSKYNIQIREMRQPLLVSKSKARDRRAGKEELVFLVPELCRSTGLTDAMRSDFRLMSALAQYTRVSPGDRIKKLLSFNRRLYNEPNVVTELNSWNLTLDTQLVSIPARVLPADCIHYGQGDPSTVNPTANWTNDFRDRQLLKCGALQNWVVVVPNRCKRECQSFITQLIRVASSMRFRIDQPYVVDLQDDRASSYAETLENIKSRGNPMLIFCVATNNRADRYAAIKKKCCVDRPVPTQVVLAKNLASKNSMSIATKVAIQMNCKIGGIPWTVSIPLQGLMVVGFDVCHDTSDKKRDFGAMVASLDPQFGRYFSAVSSHTSGEELSNDLSVNLCKALKEFKHYNSALPKRIVIYRDGVGDGQIPFVYSHEVQQIKSKLETVYDNASDVKLAYVIVTKKVNTRFFDNNRNPPPGTVVDDIVTDPTKYDFFIVAQHVGQGTVTPTNYNIIYDTSGLDVDKIQRLTYKLCHLYFNWSGTVRVPAPCQYAHKLAFLVAQSVHQSPDSVLETLLYFL